MFVPFKRLRRGMRRRCRLIAAGNCDVILAFYTILINAQAKMKTTFTAWGSMQMNCALLLGRHAGSCIRNAVSPFLTG
jgi:hypothetical protein